MLDDKKMKVVKPIETRYKGYKFRSRLEARWAVFFDELRLQYEYEFEGFSLPSGAAYLPDFLLPCLGLYVEVKPTEKLNYADLRKMVEFALEGDHHLLLIVGSPTQEAMYLIDRRTSQPIEEIEDDYEEPLPEDEIVSVFFEVLRDFGSVHFGMTPLSRSWVLLYKNLPPPDDHSFHNALLKAKQSRFEFGQHG